MTPDDFRTFADPLREPMLLVTRGGDVVAVNRSCARWLGLGGPPPPGAALGDWAIDPPERIAEFLGTCARTAQLVPGSLSFRTARGASERARVEGARLPAHRSEGRGLVLLRCEEPGQASERFLALNEKIQQLSAEVERRRLAQDEVERRAAFQLRLAELSTALIKGDPDTVDREIERWLEKICQAYGLDLISIWGGGDAADRVRRTHVWPGGGLTELSEDQIPWFFERLRAEPATVIASRREFPAGAESEREILAGFGMEAILLVPLFVEGALSGCCNFVCREPRQWPERIVEELRLLAEVIGNSIARCAMWRASRQSERDLRLAQAVAHVGSYVADAKAGTVHISPELAAILGTEPGVIPMDMEMRLVHPDDRPQVFGAHRRAIQNGGPMELEYRLLRPDGAARDVYDCWEVERDAEGAPTRIVGCVLDVTRHKRAEAELASALAELELLKERVEAENLYLREETPPSPGLDALVGESAALTECARLVRQVAPTDSTVLLVGETGTGKELLARAVHELSPRRKGPLISVNCAALPETLVESELFGHEKGAFTGAHERRRGRFELAHGGSLFLDEVGDLPLSAQAKLLRVLQEGQIERLGGGATLRVDVRVIGATHRNLQEAVARGEFRADLYYRISTFPIRVPPLRERREDIPLLARHFLEKHHRRLGSRAVSISERMLEDLTRHDWPGNVRELENTIERALIECDGRVLEGRVLVRASDAAAPRREEREAAPAQPPERGSSLHAVEREHIVRVLERTRWRIEGERGAARMLGIAPSTLRSRMRKLGIRRPPAGARTAPPPAPES